MRKLIRIIMVVIFGGCMSSSSTLPEIHQRVADQVKILIDKGHLSAPYIEIYESFSVFYYISNLDSPVQRMRSCLQEFLSIKVDISVLLSWMNRK
mgnify:CR=1 FL=1